MNAKTLMLTAFLSTLTLFGAACSSSTTATSPDASGTSGVAPSPASYDGTTTGIAQLDAQLITRQASYPLDPRLKQPGIADTLAALVEPDLDAVRAEHTTAFLGLLKLAGFKPDGSRVTPAPQVSDSDPKALAAVARYRTAQAALDQASAAAAAAYHAKFGDARRTLPVPPQNFDAVIRLTNKGAEPVVMSVGGDAQYLGMTLTGPGAVTVLASVDTTEIHMLGVEHTIAPGGHLDIPLKALRFGNRARGFEAFATEPGLYTLSVDYATVGRRGKVPNRRLKAMFPPVQFQVR